AERDARYGTHWLPSPKRLSDVDNDSLAFRENYEIHTCRKESIAQIARIHSARYDQLLRIGLLEEPDQVQNHGGLRREDRGQTEHIEVSCLRGNLFFGHAAANQSARQESRAEKRIVQGLIAISD